MNENVFSLATTVTHKFHHEYLPQWTDPSNGCFTRVLGGRFISYIGGPITAIIDVGIQFGCLMGKPVHAITITFAEVISLGSWDGGETVSLKTLCFHAAKVLLFSVTFFVNLIPLSLFDPTWRQGVLEWVEPTPQVVPPPPLAPPTPADFHAIVRQVHALEVSGKGPTATELSLLRAKIEGIRTHLNSPGKQIEGVNDKELSEIEAKLAVCQKQKDEKDAAAKKEEEDRDIETFLRRASAPATEIPFDANDITALKHRNRGEEPAVPKGEDSPAEGMVTDAEHVDRVVIQTIDEFIIKWRLFTKNGERRAFKISDAEKFAGFENSWEALIRNLPSDGVLTKTTSEIEHIRKFVFFASNWAEYYSQYKKAQKSDFDLEKSKSFWALKHIWEEIQSDRNSFKSIDETTGQLSSDFSGDTELDRKIKDDQEKINWALITGQIEALEKLVIPERGKIDVDSDDEASSGPSGLYYARRRNPPKANTGGATTVAAASTAVSRPQRASSTQPPLPPLPPHAPRIVNTPAANRAMERFRELVAPNLLPVPPAGRNPPSAADASANRTD